MNARLESLTITNFRSIRGAITVPLGAPVVLIHGPNGAGKTSVLSAIELALTGEIAAMHRSDPHYQAHVLHRGTSQGEVTLAASGLPKEARGGQIELSESGPSGVPFLDQASARFFSERCYLPQSNLGRLLEIYQYASHGEASPLTRFVTDLLGIDHLEFLIDGLNAAGDVRRTRRLVPEYREAEEALKRLTSDLSATEASAETARREMADVRARLRALISGLSLSVPALLDDANTSELESYLAVDHEERRLVEVARHDRALTALRADWEPLTTGRTAEARVALEAEDRVAVAAAEAWRAAFLHRLETVIENLRSVFPDLPSPSSTDPEFACKAVLERVGAERVRCNALLQKDDATALRLAELEQSIARAQARLAILNDQIAGLVGNAEGLGHALAALASHLEGDECPVCGRDFSEVSEEPLVSHVSARIARLTEQAGRLQELVNARAEITRTLAAAEQETSTAIQRRLAQDARTSTKERVAHLTESARQLEELTEPAREGARILRREADTRRHLSVLRTQDTRATEIRATVAILVHEREQPPLGETEPVGHALNRLHEVARAEAIQLNSQQRARKEALVECRRLRQLEHELAARERTIVEQKATRERMALAFNAAERNRLAAKSLGQTARDVRAAVVSRVFNESLNTIWRSLFVRLAPNEPFVPAFKLPESSAAAVVAQLETLHRGGGRGGAPGSMLSAGNLNTAALTLFLALHLAVEPRLPWLLLDDPVQSMDEVHIAQLAALLRTIAKGHGRQIIIAVHERPLFDYLALELSPSFAGDQLITVELGRSAAGETFAEPNFLGWTQDDAVSAA